MIGVAEIQNNNDAIHWTVHGIPFRNIWHMLLYAWNTLAINNSINMEDVEKAPSLDALLASILVKLVQQRFRIGLGRNYVDEKNLLRCIRGKIHFTDSLKYRTFEHGQAFCEFQQYSVNVPKNQIIRSTLVRLIQTGQFGPDRKRAEDLRHSLRRLTRDLDGVDLIEVRRDFIRRQQLGRNDSDYRLMLAICELFIQRLMPTDSTGQYGLPTLDRDALTLHSIYEQFVANFYRIHLKGYNINTKSNLAWHAKQFNQYLPWMKPDLIMEHQTSGKIIILDTKFTAQSLIDNQYGKLVFDSSHLYQMYAYLNTQKHLSEQHRRASGILLYPAIHSNLSEKIDLDDQQMRIECVDLTAEWKMIEKQLLDLIIEEREVESE